jgi:hypothetical protein
VFQIHGVDAHDNAVLCEQLRRSKMAEAICEAVTRLNIRFVPIKSVEQQAMLSCASCQAGICQGKNRKSSNSHFGMSCTNPRYFGIGIWEYKI